MVLPRPGEYVKGGDVIIGKTVPIKKITPSAMVNAPAKFKTIEYQKKRRDKSTQVRRDEEGVISHVSLCHKHDTELCKVRVRTERKPEVADKFSSRHSQKGTVGFIANPEDLPFSMQTGMIPDIVMSPLGFPSRMTMGKNT